MKPIAISALAMILLVGIVSAGTVTITGICRNNLLPGNVLNFTLLNTGNDTAQNLILSPVLSGAHPQNLTYPIPSLPPYVNVTTLIKVVNITRNGSFPDALILSYQQGTSTFQTIFPCIVDIGIGTSSQLYLSTNTLASKGIVLINVSVVNGGAGELDANVSEFLPPQFSPTSPSSYIVDLGPYATKNLLFTAQYPSASASYTGAIGAQYFIDNVSYARMAPISIVASQPVEKGGTGYAILLVAALAIIIIGLIGRSALKKKARHRRESKRQD
ncbi:MAG: hypothetical protein KGH61_04260 [Candidatus Micrarchaeota archaeon]|nr:hypothetical protein [Candidatus Micrarchaeota archaeon]MDE1848133.1 hypothetical protein [Candidatus Micrarchaeota archaeon]MDE1864788.1 hypothetical protein [Candidatus Micrarchaeota archaeon]